jgi:PTS system galactitol-specific IIA component
MKAYELLDPQAICLHSSATNAEEIITDLGRRLFHLGCVKDGFVAATLKREADMPTGLPLGGEINAAIPHVDVEFVNRSALALATLDQSIVFRNMVDSDEEVPVRLVIMLALDQPKSQIEMLQEVSNILQHPEVVAQLVLANSSKQILDILKSLSQDIPSEN